MVPIYGFGGKINKQTSHSFALNGDNNPEVAGVKGMLTAYRNALVSNELSGPTLFGQIL